MKRKKPSLILALIMVCGIGTSFASASADQYVAKEGPIKELFNDLDRSAYGGAFYDDDGTLNILATDRNTLLKSAKLQRTLKSRNIATIEIGEAKYSLTQLEDAQELLADRREEFSLVGVGFCESKNTLAVYTDDISAANRSAIELATGIGGIEFIKSSSFIAGPAAGNFDESPTVGDSNAVDTAKESRSAAVKPGQWVYMDRIRGNWSTLMVPCVRDYQGKDQQIGFLTVGHGWKIGDTARAGGSYLGEVANVWRGKYTDAAFIESTRSQSLRTGSGKLIKYTDEPIEGKKIYMVGANGEKSATILKTNIMFWMGARSDVPEYTENKTYKCFTYSVPSIHGDSGGAIISLSSGSDYEINGYNIGYFADTKEGAACNWQTLSNDYDVLPAQLQ